MLPHVAQVNIAAQYRIPALLRRWMREFFSELFSCTFYTCATAQLFPIIPIQIITCGAMRRNDRENVCKFGSLIIHQIQK